MKARNRSTMSDDLSITDLTWFFAGTALGSLMTFLLDPARGNYRRALIQDKAASFRRETKLRGGKLGRDIANRTKGIKANVNKLGAQEESLSDDRLIARVRSEFGRKISHPKSISVDADNGVITLSGPILESEVDDLISCVGNVRGVEDVINNLEAYDSDNNIPGLQGKGPDYLNS
jgi:hypothetical protein